MRGVLPPEVSCFHALKTQFGGQPWALPQQEQHGPEDKPWPSRAVGSVTKWPFAHGSWGASWDRVVRMLCTICHHQGWKKERARSFCSELWCIAHLCLKAFPIKVCWANREHRSQSQRGKSILVQWLTCTWRWLGVCFPSWVSWCHSSSAGFHPQPCLLVA